MELRKEIEDLFSDAEPLRVGYHLTIKLVPRFHDRPHAWAPSNSPIRLYDRRKAGFKDSPVHDSVVIRDGSIAGNLKGWVHHRCFRSYVHWAEKINFYSGMQAEEAFRQGKRPSVLKLWCDPVLSFLKAFFLRRYFIYGVDGYHAALMYVHARTMKWAKLREKRAEES